MTFSILADARQPDNSAWQSHHPHQLLPHDAHARAGVGAVASQNVTDPRLGPHVLDAMAIGMDSDAAIASVIATASHSAFRQLLAIDHTGQTAIFSGTNTLGINAEYRSQDAAAAGNLLANTTIPESMVTAFHDTKAPW